MSLKVNVGLAKKIGQPDFGSLGATCNIEFELDGGFDNGSTHQFQDAVRRAYIACREAVEGEIEANRSPSNPSHNSIGGQHHSPANRVEQYNTAHTGGNNGNNSNGNYVAGVAPTPPQSNVASGGNNTRSATASQVRAIYAISKRSGVDLPTLLFNQFGVHQPDSLSIRDASALIDQLKGTGNNAASGHTVSP